MGLWWVTTKTLLKAGVLALVGMALSFCYREYAAQQPIAALDESYSERELSVTIEGKRLDLWEVDQAYASIHRDHLKGLELSSRDKGSNLWASILQGVIERNLHYEYIKKKDPVFLEDSAHYVSCVRKWKQAVEEDKELYSIDKNRTLLKDKLCQQSVIHQYMEKRIYPAIVVSHKDIDDYYKKHRDLQSSAKKVTFRQIILPTEGVARKVRYKIRRNNFSEYARNYSQGPEGKDGGQLIASRDSHMPHFFDVVFSMKKNKISDIVRSPYGFHIFIVDKIEHGTLGHMDTKVVKAKVLQNKRDEEYRKWWEQALYAVNFEIRYI